MNDFPPTIVVRHRKENLKKCSLRGLETRSDFLFLTYPLKILPDLSSYFLLAMDAPLLSSEDAHAGVLLLDGTWRYAEKMEMNLPLPCFLKRRSLPKVLQTAYPRRQEDCPSPGYGLASIEALYATYRLLGRNAEDLLNHYYWKSAFLEKNASLFTSD